jgi:hypothetical protein
MFAGLSTAMLQFCAVLLGAAPMEFFYSATFIVLTSERNTDKKRQLAKSKNMSYNRHKNIAVRKKYATSTNPNR